MTTEYIIEFAPFCKALLHSAKHTARPVFGILLGEIDGKKVRITDAIPTFHNYTLAPMLEMSMIQIESFAKDRSVKIIGCYFANERLDDDSVPTTPRLVAKNICAKYDVDSACIVQIDNQLVSKDLKDTKEPEVVQILNNSTGKWLKHSDIDSSHSARFDDTNVITRTREHLTSRTFTRLTDFEEHLERPECDWANTWLEEHKPDIKKKL
eukprot:8060_1